MQEEQTFPIINHGPNYEFIAWNSNDDFDQLFGKIFKIFNIDEEYNDLYNFLKLKEEIAKDKEFHIYEIQFKEKNDIKKLIKLHTCIRRYKGLKLLAQRVGVTVFLLPKGYLLAGDDYREIKKVKELILNDFNNIVWLKRFEEDEKTSLILRNLISNSEKIRKELGIKLFHLQLNEEFARNYNKFSELIPELQEKLQKKKEKKYLRIMLINEQNDSRKVEKIENDFDNLLEKYLKKYEKIIEVEYPPDISKKRIKQFERLAKDAQFIFHCEFKSSKQKNSNVKEVYQIKLETVYFLDDSTNNSQENIEKKVNSLIRKNKKFENKNDILILDSKNVDDLLFEEALKIAQIEEKYKEELENPDTKRDLILYLKRRICMPFQEIRFERISYFIKLESCNFYWNETRSMADSYQVNLQLLSNGYLLYGNNAKTIEKLKKEILEFYTNSFCFKRFQGLPEKEIFQILVTFYRNKKSITEEVGARILKIMLRKDYVEMCQKFIKDFPELEEKLSNKKQKNELNIIFVKRVHETREDHEIEADLDKLLEKYCQSYEKIIESNFLTVLPADKIKELENLIKSTGFLFSYELEKPGEENIDPDPNYQIKLKAFYSNEEGKRELEKKAEDLIEKMRALIISESQ